MSYAGKYVIGVTGTIGTGKSTVLRILEESGAEVIDADRVAHEVMEPGGPAYQAVVEAFGPEILDPDGRVNRRKLGELVFNDRESLARLEQIVHPVVFETIKKRVANTSRPVVVIEAIKLLEAGLSVTICDEVWVVVADPEVQLARLRERGVGEAEARRRLAMQTPQAQLVERADVVIDNNYDLDALRRQVMAQWERLR